jgi:integrase
MSILSECPICRRKQSIKNKKCPCGEDLDRAKRSGRVNYWITYRLPGGKQRRESVAAMEGLSGNSIDDARTALSKRSIQKKEKRILDMMPESKMTFQDLTDWYLKLEKVKALASYDIMKIRLAQFNAVFGETIISDIKLTNLENYQMKRLNAGMAPATVDHEIKKMKTAVIKAFDDGIVSGDVLRVFKRCKPTLRRGSDVRDRILTGDEYQAIMANLPQHAKPVFATGYYAGMRRAEILGLTWDKVDLKGRVIRLEAADTKDKEKREIPMCRALYDALKDVPMAIHDNHVFQYRGKPITSIRRALMPACKKAGVVYGRFEKGGFIFHDLRHTFNTNMRKAGVAESVIMAITGHSTREMFDRYNRVDLDDTKQAVDQMGVFLASVDQSVDQATFKK